MVSRSILLKLCNFVLPLTGLITVPLVFASEETIVITGTMSPVEINDSPVPITVLTRENIHESGAQQLNEVLDQVPGLMLNKQHGQQGETLMMQGMNSNHVLVMVDGVPISQGGNAINTERFMLTNVARIEIVPGSSSALYGSSAMGGVVNIITNDHKNQEYQKYQIANSQAEDGSALTNNQTFYSANIGKQLSSHSFSRSSVTYTEYQGYDIEPDTWEQQVASGYRWALNQQLTFKQSYIGLDWLGGRLERPYTESRAGRNFRRVKHEDSDEFSIDLKRDTYDAEQQIHYELDQYNTAQDLLGSSRNDLERRASFSNFRAASHWFNELAEHSLTFGIVANRSTLEQTKETNDERVDEVPLESMVSAEAFVQDDWMITDRFQIVSGLRGQWDDGFGSFFSPKISSRFNFNDTFFWRGSIGVGYRAPSLRERYYIFDHSHLGYIILGNESVEPESSVALHSEIANTLSFSTIKWNWSLSAYQQDVTNLIENDLIDGEEGLDTYTFVNIGEARIQGLNLATSLNTHIQNHEFNLSLGYHYLYAMDQKTDQELERRPNHQWDIKTRARLDAVLKPIFSAHLKTQSSQVVDRSENIKAHGFSTLDLHSTYQISRHFSLNFNVLNATDVQREPEVDNEIRPIQGRTWRVGVSYQH